MAAWGNMGESGASRQETVVAALRNPRTRRSAILRTSEVPDEQLGELALLVTVRDKNLQLALQSRFRRSPEESTRQLVALVSESNPARRLEAAKMLVAMEHPQARASLVRLVTHGDRRVRETALEAVGRQRVRQSVPKLLDALEDFDWETRRLASDALGHIADPDTSIDLVPLLDDPHVLVRRSALLALGRIASPQTLLAVARFTEDRDLLSRRRADAAMRETIVEHPESLLVLLESQDEGCQALAVDYISEFSIDLGALADCANCEADSDQQSEMICRWLHNMEWPEILACIAQADLERPWVVEYVDGVANDLDPSQLADLLALAAYDPLFEDRLSMYISDGRGW